LVPAGANLSQPARAIDIVFGIGAVLVAASPERRNQPEEEAIGV
jgi:hypothetical protein